MSLVILEAFSQRLQQEYGGIRTPLEILEAWLTEQLQMPRLVNGPGENKVSRVIQAEVVMLTVNGTCYFEGRTATGRQLLDSLYQYCESYDHWQFARWLHDVRASDFDDDDALEQDYPRRQAN
ncbi:MAG: hypothetical protein K2X01_10715 [Cyanobacteria bacterium]|nr:hypothetical protein [Cyanobacteriota bacterium]